MVRIAGVLPLRQGFGVSSAERSGHAPHPRLVLKTELGFSVQLK
jgi:hypothetical protein